MGIGRACPRTSRFTCIARKASRIIRDSRRHRNSVIMSKRVFKFATTGCLVTALAVSHPVYADYTAKLSSAVRVHHLKSWCSSPITSPNQLSCLGYIIGVADSGAVPLPTDKASLEHGDPMKHTSNGYSW